MRQRISLANKANQVRLTVSTQAGRSTPREIVDNSRGRMLGEGSGACEVAGCLVSTFKLSHVRQSSPNRDFLIFTALLELVFLPTRTCAALRLADLSIDFSFDLPSSLHKPVLGPGLGAFSEHPQVNRPSIQTAAPSPRLFAHWTPGPPQNGSSGQLEEAAGS